VEESEMTVLLDENKAIRKAHEVYREFTADAELMDMVEAREKWLKDVNTRLASAERQGMQKNARETARRMIDEGFEAATISRITGLSEDEIRTLT